MSFRYDLLKSPKILSIAAILNCWKDGRNGSPIPEGMKEGLTSVFKEWCIENFKAWQEVYEREKEDFVKYCVGMYGAIIEAAHKPS